MATINGTVRFDVGQKPHSLRFTTNALCMLEDKTNSTVLQIAGEVAYGLSLTTLRAMFWAGSKDGDLTLAQAGDLVDDIGITEARRLAVEAFEAAFPKAEPDDEQNPPMAAG